MSPLGIVLTSLGIFVAATLITIDAIRQHKEEATAKKQREEYLARKAQKQGTR